MKTEQKQLTVEDIAIKPIKDSGKRCTNKHGGMRDTSEGKPKFKYIDADFLHRILQYTKACYTEKQVLYQELFGIVNKTNRRNYFDDSLNKFVTTAKRLLHFNYNSIYEGLTAFALFMEEGAKKYSFENWKLLDTEEDIERFKESCLRHFVQWSVGEQDENHLLATVFNLMALYYHTRKE